MFERKEERRPFTYHEKEQMLLKSDGLIIATAKDSFNDSCPFLA